MLRVRVGAACLAVLVAAGCLEVPAPDAALDEAAGATSGGPWDLPRFDLAGTDCVVAGFVAAYGQDWGAPSTYAEVWTLADIREEIGNPTHDATGFPVTGPLMGHWHMGVRCASVATTGGDAEEFLFGFVGAMVEPPAWDAGGADVHFLLSGLSFQNGTVGDAARASTTADVTRTAKVDVDWLTPKELPRSSAYVAFLDAQKGLYESASTLAHLRDAPERTVRLWWQVPADGSSGHGAHDHDSGASATSFGSQEPMPGEFHPLYWDLRLSGGPQYTTPPGDGVEIGSHNMFSFEHGPVIAQPCLTNIYENAELSFTTGRVVDDVTLALLWTH